MEQWLVIHFHILINNRQNLYSNTRRRSPASLVVALRGFTSWMLLLLVFLPPVYRWQHMWQTTPPGDKETQGMRHRLCDPPGSIKAERSQPMI